MSGTHRREFLRVKTNAKPAKTVHLGNKMKVLLVGEIYIFVSKLGTRVPKQLKEREQNQGQPIPSCPSSAISEPRNRGQGFLAPLFSHISIALKALALVAKKKAHLYDQALGMSHLNAVDIVLGQFLS